MLSAALACAVVCAGGARGLVLCIGAGGHVAVEADHIDDTCGHCGDCPPPGAAALDASACGQCGGCLDIPLSLHDGNRAAPGGRDARHAAAPPAEHASARAAATPVEGMSGGDGGGLRGCPLQRTPILRI